MKYQILVNVDTPDLMTSEEAHRRVRRVILNEFPYMQAIQTLNWKGLPHDGLPDAAICFFKDGQDWCCVFGDFQNLQVSPKGFGATFSDALDSLNQHFQMEVGKVRALSAAVNQ